MCEEIGWVVVHLGHVVVVVHETLTHACMVSGSDLTCNVTIENDQKSPTLAFSISGVFPHALFSGDTRLT